jgi:hypothetical protein
VDCRLGEIEHLPVEDASVDVGGQTCVIQRSAYRRSSSQRRLIMNLTEPAQSDSTAEQRRPEACCDGVLLSTCCPPEVKPACCARSSRAATCGCQSGGSTRR